MRKKLLGALGLLIFTAAPLLAQSQPAVKINFPPVSFCQKVQHDCHFIHGVKLNWLRISST